MARKCLRMDNMVCRPYVVKSIQQIATGSERDAQREMETLKAGLRSHASQRTSLICRFRQLLHRIERTASRTRVSPPCVATRSATETRPACPQLHRTWSAVPTSRLNRRPSRRSAVPSSQVTTRGQQPQPVWCHCQGHARARPSAARCCGAWPRHHSPLPFDSVPYSLSRRSTACSNVSPSPQPLASATRQNCSIVSWRDLMLN